MGNWKIYRVCEAIMFTFCFLTVIWMTKKEITRFWDNNDTSSVAIKRFNKSNDENIKFPTFSICFQGGYVMYSSKEFQKDSGTTAKNFKTKIRKYRSFLEGFIPYNHNAMKRFSSLSSLAIKLKGLVRKFDILNENSIKINRWNNSMHNTNLPFVASYQTTRLICFTLEDKLSSQIGKTGDLITFQRSALKKLEWRDSKNRNAGWIYLYMHAQGQLIRNLDKPIFSLNVVSLNVNNSDFNGHHAVSLKRVDVLKNRQDASTPCRSYPINEDTEYLRSVVEKVQCVPIYWKALNISGADVPLCNSTDDYRTLHEVYNGYLPAPMFWIELKWEPCYEMVVSSVLNTKEADNFRIEIRYQDLGSRYFETINSRDFGFENLWSSLGGIVGIFLGYSIMNIFEMISKGLTWMYDKLEKKSET